MPAMSYLLALLVGVFLTAQVGLNASAARYLDNRAVMAAFVSFITGTVAFAAYILVARVSWPSRGTLAGVPLWAWAGGVLGACYVLAATILAPRLGAAAFLSLVVVGQLAASLLIDHFGWLGFAQHSISAPRLLGAGLLIAGVLLITR